MRAGLRVVPQRFVSYLLVGCTLLFVGVSSSLARSNFEIDIRGRLEVGSPLGSVDSVPGPGIAGGEYWILFQYPEKGANRPSTLDRLAKITDGSFEIRGLQENKVYKVIVERLIFTGAPYGIVRETIPINIPSDLFFVTPVSPQSERASPVLEIEIPVESEGQEAQLSQGLAFMYDGEKVFISPLNLAPEVR